MKRLSWDKLNAWRRRSKPLRPSSKKAQSRVQQRARLLEQVRGEPCTVGFDDGCQGVAVDGHEPLTRARGGDPTDPEQVIGVCRYCHDMIHAHPLAAAKLGVMLSQYDQTRDERNRRND